MSSRPQRQTEKSDADDRSRLPLRIAAVLAALVFAAGVEFVAAREVLKAGFLPNVFCLDGDAT